jgi:hypothetical protein
MHRTRFQERKNAEEKSGIFLLFSLTFGALYEIWHDKAVTDENRPAHCQVCGKEMDARNGTRILHYELVKMPDGTNV